MNKNNENKRIEDHEIHEEVHELFSTAKEISLSHEEKNEGMIAFQNFMKENPDGKSSILSPYIKNLFISTFNIVKQRQLVAVALALVLILGGVGGTAYAAGNSLPGDFLYPIKINVNEKLESTFAVGTEAKARVAVKHAVTRVEEVEQLAVQGKVEKADEQSVSSNLAVVQENILKLKAEGNIDAAISISSDFENSLNDHRKNLENIAQKSKKDVSSFLARNQANIQNNMLASAKERLILEGNLSTSSELIINKNTANSELASSQKKIKNIEASVNTSSNIDIETKNNLTSVLNNITEGEEKINVGAYSNALVLFRDVKEHTDKLEAKGKKPYVYVPGKNTVTTNAVITSTTTTSLSSSTFNTQSSGSTSVEVIPTVSSPSQTSNNPSPAPVPTVPAVVKGLLH